MWAGRRTGKGKGQRDRVGKTSIRTESSQARVTDLDPIRVSPYGPAACHLPHREAGHTTAPDRMHRADQKLLASTGASTHVRPSRGTCPPGRQAGARSKAVHQGRNRCGGGGVRAARLGGSERRGWSTVADLRVGASLDGMLVPLLAATGVPLRALRLGGCGLALKGERGGRCR